MVSKDFKHVERVILAKLESDLNHNLFYHNAEHTRDVLEMARKLAELEGVTPYGISTLEAAALGHDIGFLVRYKDNEEVGAKLVKQYLLKFGYTSDEVDFISKMIHSTKMPQSPKTHLDKILCDADLANLGRKDFYIKTELLRRELSAMGIKDFSPKEWYENALKLLEGHQYWTKSAANLWQLGKERHIGEIKELLDYAK